MVRFMWVLACVWFVWAVDVGMVCMRVVVRVWIVGLTPTRNFFNLDAKTVKIVLKGLQVHVLRVRDRFGMRVKVRIRVRVRVRVGVKLLFQFRC